MNKLATIEGMSCGHCAHHVTEALEEVKGIKNVEVSLEERSARFEADPSVTDEAIKAAVDEYGYKVVDIKNV